MAVIVAWHGRWCSPTPQAPRSPIGNIRYLPRVGLSRTLETMEVHLTPEQEAQLTCAASRAGTDAERWVRDTVLRLIADHSGVPAAPPAV